MRSKVRVTGLRELERNLAKLEKRASRRTAARNALKAGGKLFQATAKRLAPDNPATGEPDLHRGIGIGTRLTTRQKGLHTKRDPIEVFVGVIEGIGHGHLQEFGNINHAATPFMRPAWSQNKMRAIVVIRKDLNIQFLKGLGRQAKRRSK